MSDPLTASDGQYEAAQAPDPYSEAYSLPATGSQENAPAPPPAPESVRGDTNGRGRSRSRSPRYRSRSPPRDDKYRRRSPPPARRPTGAPINPNPSNVLGVFGLSIRSTERDLEAEFSRHGTVEKVTIVYDQRSDRSRGFGFIRMATIEDAQRCIDALNGQELNGRRIRVDFSVTERAHAPTPGEYMGHRRPLREDRYFDRDRDRGRDFRDRDRDRDRDYRGGYDRDRDRRDRRDDFGRDSDRRDNWRDRDRDRDRDRRSPPPRRHSRSPPPRRRSYSRSPPPRDRDRSPRKDHGNGDSRW